MTNSIFLVVKLDMISKMKSHSSRSLVTAESLMLRSSYNLLQQLDIDNKLFLYYFKLLKKLVDDHCCCCFRVKMFKSA